jgi:hypothetical protein
MLLAEEDKNAINGGLAKIFEKTEAVALGETIQVLAHDVIFVLRYSYEDDPACASMVVRLEEAEHDLAVLLNEVRTCLLSCNDKM